MRKNFGLLVALAVFLISTLCWAISFGVESATEQSVHIAEENYQRLEDEYMNEVKEILNENGCTFSGVTLTRTVMPEGRTYSVLIHHVLLDGNVMLQNKVLEEIGNIQFVDKESHFEVSIY